MRRIAVLLVALLILAGGGYTAYWFYVAGRVPGEIDKWAKRERGRGLDVAYDGVKVSGFPGPFAITLTNLRLGQRDNRGQWVWTGKTVNAEAGPFAIRTVRYTVPGGGVTVVTANDLPAPLTSRAETAHGTVAIDSRGRPHGLSITVVKPEYTGGGLPKALTADSARFDLLHRPATPGARGPLDIVWRLENISLPLADPGPFGPVIKLAQGKTTLTMASEDLLKLRSSRKAATAWRNAGGQWLIEDMGLEWGPLAFSASGDLGLDEQMRLQGLLQTRTRGYQAALAALVQSGEIKQQQAMAIGIFLDLIAKTPESGGARVLEMPVTAKGGELYLGPKKVIDLKPIPFPD